jgi:DNA replication and repair protein RecF
MSFLTISLSGFRNLADAELDIGAERIFLVGENGQGKTNFLEALYYLSFGSSFRGSADREAAAAGGGRFSLLGRVISPLAAAGMPPEEIEIRWQDHDKDIRRNGKPVKDRKELISLNPAVVFCHEDFSFAAGEPERRRYFFDQTESLVSSGYIDLLREYKRVLRQRNFSLKAGREDLLALIDGQLAETGLALVRSRRALLAEIEGMFSERFETVSRLGRRVSLRYRPSWGQESGVDAICAKIRAKRGEELAIGTSLSGPHRDRWQFLLDEEDFARTASTGQLRLLSLTLRLIQAEYYTSRTSGKPVLLLDDVLLELDAAKRRRFLELLPAKGQSFFTFLPGEAWEEFRTGATKVLGVEDGRFTD